MKSGDEPQHFPDNAPRTGSVRTRAIARAREAYVAQNLYSLMDILSDPQVQHFYRALVRQALQVAGPVLEGSPEDRERQVLRLVQSWVDRPTPEVDAAAHALAEELMRLQEHQAETAYFRRLVAGNLGHTVGSQRDYLRFCVMYVIQVFYYAAAIREGPQVLPQNALHQRAHRWQVEVAWAILNDKEPPPFE